MDQSDFNTKYDNKHSVVLVGKNLCSLCRFVQKRRWEIKGKRNSQGIWCRRLGGEMCESADLAYLIQYVYILVPSDHHGFRLMNQTLNEIWLDLIIDIARNLSLREDTDGNNTKGRFMVPQYLGNFLIFLRRLFAAFACFFFLATLGLS